MNHIKLTPKKLIFTTLLILWMIVIFAYSSKNADDSTEDSHRIGMWIGRMVVADFEQLPYEEQIAFAEKVDHPIRKTAHGMEYAVLAIFAVLAVTEWWPGKVRYFSGWIISVIYACSDEFHQLFVPGRSGQLLDVVIDSLGAFAGVIMVLAVYKLANRK